MSYHLKENIKAATQLRISDVTGRTLYTNVINGLEGKETISLPLSNGIYFWELINEEGIQAKGKMGILN